MDRRKLAISIAREDTELGVRQILEAEGLWDDLSMWEPLGGQENNGGIVANQQPNSDAALVEKLTNSLDALTMRACKARGINPEDQVNAPKSPADAAEMFFGIPEGNLCLLDDGEIEDIAGKREVVMSFTGNDTSHKKTPSVVIYDMGEGQSPLSMPGTVLSTNASNKLRVPFSQGRFNMGGTGILPFCGKLGMQAVIARKAPDIPDDGSDPTIGDWGFTVIRKFTPDECPGTKQSHYRYLVDADGAIMNLGPEAMPILPEFTPWKGSFHFNDAEFGMFIKMYEVNELPRINTFAQIYIKNRFDALLPNICYPVSIQECRRTVKPDTGGNSYGKITGLKKKLERRIAKGEAANIDNAVLKIDGATLRLNAYVYEKAETLKRDLGDISGDREGILFVEGGQTQGTVRKGRFKTNAIGLSFLENYLLVTVDCVDIRPALREELFMPSRDRLRSGSAFSKKVVQAVEKKLHDSKPLAAEAQRRRDEEISKHVGSDDRQQERIISEIMRCTGLRSLLSGKKAKIPMRQCHVNAGKFNGKRNPSFFKPADTKVLAVHIGDKVRARFTTDAENGYFTRTRNPGTYTLKCNDIVCSDESSMTLRDGTATLAVNLPGNAAVDDVITYELAVHDREQDRTFRCKFKVKVLPQRNPRQYGKNGGGRKNKPKSDDEGGSLKGLAGTMPQRLDVYKDTWPDGMDENTAIVIHGSASEGVLFYVNMDYAPLVGQLKSSSKLDERTIETIKAKFSNGVFAAAWEATAKAYARNDDDYTKHAQNAVNDTAASIIFTSEGAGYGKTR